MQVLLNKCFFLNLEKKLAKIRFVVFEKNAKTHTLIPKNVVTEPKVGYSNNQQFQSFKNKLIMQVKSQFQSWFPEA